jgi:hypothetical protein
MGATLPKPVKTDFRFSVRVDYFATAEDAVAWFTAKRDAGEHIHSPNDAADSGQYAGLYGVHWHDRKGEGWYG